MHVSVYLPLLLSAVFGLASPAVSRRLPPRQATWLLSAGSAVLAVAAAASLGLLALTAAARLPLIAAIGHWPVHALAAQDPVREPVAVAAVVAVVLLAVLGGRAIVRRARAIATVYRLARHHPGDSRYPGDRSVVVVDDGATAYAVPGRHGRIVVSRDLLAGLAPAQQAGLVGHERSHLAHRHYLHRAITDIAAAVNPLLRGVPEALQFTTERWADEDAVASAGDRAAMAAALATAGLVAHRGPVTGTESPLPDPVSAVALPAVDGAVPRRVRALLADPPRRRPMLALAVAGVVVVAGAATADATWDAHQMFEHAQSQSQSVTSQPVTQSQSVSPAHGTDGAPLTGHSGGRVR